MNAYEKELQVQEKLGAYLPDDDEIYTEEMDKIVTIFKKITLPKEIYAPRIARRDEEERCYEALKCFDIFENPSLCNRILPFFEHITLDKSLRYQQNHIYYYEKEDHTLEREVSVPVGRDSQTSVTLAKTFVSLLKSNNPEEFYYSFETGETLPIFLEEFFASYLGEKKENADLLFLTQMTRMWGNHTLANAYTSNQKKKNKRTYLSMILSVYPLLKGYVDALKLWEVYKRNPVQVLQGIERILLGEESTMSLLEKLNVSSISSDEILEDRCKMMQLYRR